MSTIVFPPKGTKQKIMGKCNTCKKEFCIGIHTQSVDVTYNRFRGLECINPSCTRYKKERETKHD